MPVTIPAPQLFERIKSGQTLDLIDVRTPVEFQEVHTPHARLVPLDRLDPKEVATERQGAAGEPIYLVCKSGTRAKMAADKFQAAGIEVVCVEGGMAAWEQAGLPVVRGKKAFSVDRQVRIVMGSLVLLGLALGYFVHEGFLGLSAFVGCGMIYAGIADSCPMVNLISRMPWNQAEACCKQ